MKLIRAFIAFVVASLVIGVGSAFNGQNYTPVEEINSPVEISETENVLEEESTEIVDTSKTEAFVVEEKNDNNNSFSASNEEKVVSNTKQTVKNTKTTNDTNANDIVQNNSNTTITETTTKVEVKENSPIDNSSNDDKANATNYSITKGNAEYETEGSCYAAGLAIQNKELDVIMDWNEEHEDNQDEWKKPIIGSSMCIIVMKNGKEHWYLHFLTVTQENLDDELKNLYK